MSNRKRNLQARNYARRAERSGYEDINTQRQNFVMGRVLDRFTTPDIADEMGMKQGSMAGIFRNGCEYLATKYADHKGADFLMDNLGLSNLHKTRGIIEELYALETFWVKGLTLSQLEANLSGATPVEEPAVEIVEVHVEKELTSKMLMDELARRIRVKQSSLEEELANIVSGRTEVSEDYCANLYGRLLKLRNMVSVLNL